MIFLPFRPLEVQEYEDDGLFDTFLEEHDQQDSQVLICILQTWMSRAVFYC
jgi:hypothetical protein